MEATEATKIKRGAPNGPKQRVITFVATVGINNEQEVILICHRTTACTIEDAFKEVAREGMYLCGAIQGHHEFISEPVLRKPTYNELLEKVGLATKSVAQ